MKFTLTKLRDISSVQNWWIIILLVIVAALLSNVYSIQTEYTTKTFAETTTTTEKISSRVIPYIPPSAKEDVCKKITSDDKFIPPVYSCSYRYPTAGPFSSQSGYCQLDDLYDIKSTNYTCKPYQLVQYATDTPCQYSYNGKYYTDNDCNRAMASLFQVYPNPDSILNPQSCAFSPYMNSDQDKNNGRLCQKFAGGKMFAGVCVDKMCNASDTVMEADGAPCFVTKTRELIHVGRKYGGVCKPIDEFNKVALKEFQRCEIEKSSFYGDTRVIYYYTDRLSNKIDGECTNPLNPKPHPNVKPSDLKLTYVYFPFTEKGALSFVDIPICKYAERDKEGCRIVINNINPISIFTNQIFTARLNVTGAYVYPYDLSKQFPLYTTGWTPSTQMPGKKLTAIDARNWSIEIGVPSNSTPPTNPTNPTIPPPITPPTTCSPIRLLQNPVGCSCSYNDLPKGIFGAAGVVAVGLLNIPTCTPVVDPKVVPKPIPGISCDIIKRLTNPEGCSCTTLTTNGGLKIALGIYLKENGQLRCNPQPIDSSTPPQIPIRLCALDYVKSFLLNNPDAIVGCKCTTLGVNMLANGTVIKNGSSLECKPDNVETAPTIGRSCRLQDIIESPGRAVGCFCSTTNGSTKADGIVHLENKKLVCKKTN